MMDEYKDKRYIKEIIKELEQKPITVSTLNTRVDTARDLVFKLLARAKEITKQAKFAERREGATLTISFLLFFL